jgi:hypothetical protein
MSAKSILPQPPEPTGHGNLHATRRDVIERLADPYLTDHDRWVLRQFASFLGGQAPGPDPRVERRPVERPLFSRARRATL